jgi:polar amino acid transport system permease protein
VLESLLETWPGLATAARLLALEPPGWGGNLLRGAWASIQIAVGAFGLGLVIGTFGALGKLHGGPVTRDLLAVYTTVVRAVPELILILLIYYAGTDLLNRGLAALGQRPVEIPGVIAGIIVLGVVQGAYATEVLRGAIQSVPKGQIEAARAFGMAPVALFRRVTVPLMLPMALPGLANLWLIATKDTALLAVVGFAELTLETRQAAGATRSQVGAATAYFTFFMAAGAIYLTMTLVSGRVFGWLEKRARRGEVRA